MKKHVICLLALIGAPLLSPIAHAQTEQVVEAGVWVQIEALPNQAEAEDRARAYSAIFDNVAGFNSRGWYAIALGPFATRDEAIARLTTLRSEGMVPQDSFISTGKTYSANFWPAGQADRPAASATPSVDPATPAPATPAPATPAPVAEAPAPAPEPVIIEETPQQARASEAALSAEQRVELQAALQWFGHYTAALDGAIGPGTRGSMAAWQTANGLEPTGILTTRQRQMLVDGYNTAQAELGLAKVIEEKAGIEITLPTALVEFDHYEPPFVHYRAKDGSDVRVVLISQPGDQSTLYGLYDLLQTLEIVPLEGERSRSERSFTIDGRSTTVASHAYAELSKGLVKGYVLVWNPRDDERIARVQAAMQSSFRSVSDTALDPGLVPMSAESRQGLLSGLEVRRPVISRSGFYVDATGTVATVSEVVEGCNRITLDLRHEARLVSTDTATGLALVAPQKPLSPPVVADLLQGPAREGQDVAISGYSYEDKLPAPTLAFGKLEEMKGLNGVASLMRLGIEALPGDAGGPVLDASGAVMGMLLPREANAARKLPDTVEHALQAATLAPRLAEAGIAPRAATTTGALAPEDLNRRAEGMTVLVSCW